MNIQDLDRVKSNIDGIISEAYFLIKDEIQDHGDNGEEVDFSALSILQFVTIRYKELNGDENRI